MPTIDSVTVTYPNGAAALRPGEQATLTALLSPDDTLTAVLTAGGESQSVSIEVDTIDPALEAIDATGTDDVTVPLNAYLAAHKTGRIVFPDGGRYRIEGTLLVKGADVDIDCRGSVFFATTKGLGVPTPNRKYPNRTRSQWRIEDSRASLSNAIIRGASPSTGPDGIYDESLEAQHGVDIAKGRDVLLDNLDIGGVWGDLVYVGAKTVGATIRNSTLVGSSRQGVSVTDGTWVLFEDTLIDQARRSLIDLEPNTANNEIGVVAFRRCRFGRSRFTTVTLAAPVAAPVHDIAWEDCVMLPGARCRFQLKRPAGTPRGANISVVRLTNGVTGNEPFIQALNIDGLHVIGCQSTFTPPTRPFPPRDGTFGDPQAPVMAVGCTDVEVVDNAFAPKPAGMPDLVER